MEIKHLRSFVTLAEELHFGRAAARLAIVQPALSMQLKLLEEELGVRLLDRNRHAVALTEVGRLFLPEAIATLHQAAHAADVARSAGRGEIGRVRLSYISSVLPELLPTLSRTVHERYPRVELALKEMTGPDQVLALKNGQLDFGLMRLPVDTAGIRTQVVLREPFVVAMHRDHPLAALPSLAAGDISNVPLFMLARRYAPGYCDQLRQALQQCGATLNIASEIGEFTSMLALVSAGLGVGLVPAQAGRALPVNVVSRPLDLGGYRATTGLAWVELDTAVKVTVFNVIKELFFAA
jgi:DNA-binding transcriptional LysR family regulator